MCKSSSHAAIRRPSFLLLSEFDILFLEQFAGAFGTAVHGIDRIFEGELIIGGLIFVFGIIRGGLEFAQLQLEVAVHFHNLLKRLAEIGAALIKVLHVVIDLVHKTGYILEQVVHPMAAFLRQFGIRAKLFDGYHTSASKLDHQLKTLVWFNGGLAQLIDFFLRERIALPYLRPRWYRYKQRENQISDIAIA